MVKIGMTGSIHYENRVRIKTFIWDLIQKHGKDFMIIGTGDSHGADKYIRKYALELGCEYKELNAPHTVQNLYSMMGKEFYSRQFNPKSIAIRDKIYANTVDIAVLYLNPTEDSGIKIKNISRSLLKANKKAVILY